MGALFQLTKNGFNQQNKKIYGTKVTREISQLQLQQEISSVFIYNQMVKGKRFQTGPDRGRFIPFKPVIYTKEHLEKAMAHFTSSPYEKPVRVSDDLTITFYEAGHIPGSSQILFEMQTPKGKINFLTTYDLGRTDYQILGHPVSDTPLVKFPYKNFKNIDFVVLEATYGNKTHRPLEESFSVLETAIKDAAKSGGKLIIPAFSVMRTQMLYCFLYKLNQEGKIPSNMMFYSSSPMADQVSRIIVNNWDDLDPEAKANMRNQNNNYFHFDKLTYHKTYKETNLVLGNQNSNPLGIIASSGMCEQGRVVAALKSTISDPKNIVLMTGYVSPNTRGQKLLNKERRIAFDDGYVDLRADVRRMSGLSGHADVTETIAHVRNIDPDKRLKGIFIKHGEKESCWALREEIIKKLGYNPNVVTVMKKGQEYSLNTN
jgi:metallo-beta-lactamase family protein